MCRLKALSVSPYLGLRILKPAGTGLGVPCAMLSCHPSMVVLQAQPYYETSEIPPGRCCWQLRLWVWEHPLPGADVGLFPKQGLCNGKRWAQVGRDQHYGACREPCIGAALAMCPRTRKGAVGWGAALLHHPQSTVEEQGTEERFPSGAVALLAWPLCNRDGERAGGQQAAMAWTAAPASCPGSCRLWKATSPLRAVWASIEAGASREGGDMGACEPEQPAWSCWWPCPSILPTPHALPIILHTLPTACS